MLPFPVPLWSNAANGRRRLASRLRRIEQVFGIASIVGQPGSPQQVVDYYSHCFEAFGRYHSTEGAVHLALNDGGRFDPDGFYAQARLIDQAWRDGPAPADVLELAFGKGLNLLWLAPRWPEVRFSGIDLTPRHVEHAQAQAQRLGLGNVQLQQGDFHTLPYADASFDALYCIEALCHATDVPRALAELARVLRPGGGLTLFDGYRTRQEHELSPDEVLAITLVERSMATERFQHVAELPAAAAAAGLRLIATRQLDAQVMPNLKRLERLTGAWLRVPVLARRALARRSPERGRNLIAGWLMPLTVGLGLHSYRQFNFEKSE